MSGLFSSKKAEDPKYISTPQDDRINELWNKLMPQAQKKLDSMGKEYTGDLVAPLSEMENSVLGKFSSYLEGGLGTNDPSYKMAEKEMGNIFGDYYDPWKKGGPIEYTSRRLQKTLIEDLLPASRHASAGKGNFWTQGQKDNEAGIVTDIMDELAKYAYGEEDALRNLRASMIPQAVSMSGEYGNRLKDSMGMAGYERTQYQQPLNSAKYAEFKRLAEELNIPLEGLLSLTGQSGGALAYPQYEASPFEQYVMPIAQMGTKLASSMMLAGNNNGGGGGGSTYSNWEPEPYTPQQNLTDYFNDSYSGYDW
jgi:hypothetical protein